jgi:hypothetical protein
MILESNTLDKNMQTISTTASKTNTNVLTMKRETSSVESHSTGTTNTDGLTCPFPDM